MSRVVHVHSTDEWNSIAKAHETNGSILVCKFGADFCGPCKALAPKVNSLSLQYDDQKVLFLSIDIEECEEVADKFNITSLPTTLIIKKCKIVKEIIGADIIGIKAGIDNLMLPELYN